MKSTYPRGAKLCAQPQDAQLILVTAGAIEIHTGAGRWVVTPGLGLWMPLRTCHAVTTLSRVEMLVLSSSDPAGLRGGPGEYGRVFALHVTDLLRELVLELSKISPQSARATILAGLVMLELKEMPDAATFLPWPKGLVACAAADIALSDMLGVLEIDELAAGVSRSGRALSRLFLAETGLSFQAWRRRARIVAAARRLSYTSSIPSVAAEFGYESNSAFCDAFHKEIGVAPNEFLKLYLR
ncbi:hypothetical protein AYJ54_06650 [Bradyrhizobium centrolobii]|uniref:HTH araC/xylS-type domain-containing protein n=1 Tax=Bradyrhizobium centrolobii TaxID=1505087 RepID=A0A176YZI9_9BRAD|nr:hypothetical protein AYJ54_06650 [Bradyrhizobium centrolobii]